MKEWISSIVGVEWAELAYFAVIACGIVALLLLALTVVKFLRRPVYERGRRGKQARLAVTDAAAIDDRRRLVLLRRDDIEHLILIGGPTDIVIESDIRKNAPARPLSITSNAANEAPSRASPPAKQVQQFAPKPSAPPPAAPPAQQPPRATANTVPPRPVTEPPAESSRTVASPVSARLPDQSPRPVEKEPAVRPPVAAAPKEVAVNPEFAKPKLATLEPKPAQEPKVADMPPPLKDTSPEGEAERDAIDALLDGITQPRSVAAKSGSN